MKEFTSYFWYTEQSVIKACKLISTKTASGNLRGFYLTGIKGIGLNLEKPEECWAVTNRYDPRIVALRKDSEN